MNKNQKTLITVIIVAAILIAGSIFYYAYSTKKVNTANQSNQNNENVEQNQNTQSNQNSQAYIAPQVLNDEPILGDKNAPVTIVEYSSFLCGHCINFQEKTFPQLKKDYIDTGKAKFVSRVFPGELAKASLCASEQNKYWDFTDYLFKNAFNLFQNNIETADQLKQLILNVGEKLNLDKNQLSSCYDSTKYDDLIQKWNDEATEAKVEGTPTFFVNGQALVGDQLYKTFQETIDNFLNTVGR